MLPQDRSCAGVSKPFWILLVVLEIAFWRARTRSDAAIDSTKNSFARRSLRPEEGRASEQELCGRGWIECSGWRGVGEGYAGC